MRISSLTSVKAWARMSRRSCEVWDSTRSSDMHFCGPVLASAATVCPRIFNRSSGWGEGARGCFTVKRCRDYQQATHRPVHGRERRAFYPGHKLCAPTKAVYICADHPVVTLILRLRHGGGPYIQLARHPLSRSGGHISSAARCRESVKGNPLLADCLSLDTALVRIARVYDTTSGLIMSCSSCSRIWQCHTYSCPPVLGLSGSPMDAGIFGRLN